MGINRHNQGGTCIDTGPGQHAPAGKDPYKGYCSPEAPAAVDRGAVAVMPVPVDCGVTRLASSGLNIPAEYSDSTPQSPIRGGLFLALLQSHKQTYTLYT